MVHHTTEKNPPESPHCNTSFSGEIQNGRQSTDNYIHMDLVLEVSDLEIRFRCRYQLNVGCQIIW